MARKRKPERLTPAQVVKQTLGVRPLARSLECGVTTVREWTEHVPSKHHARILELADGRITADDLIYGRECHG